MMDTDQGGIPPIIGDAHTNETKQVSRWRWWLHLIVLGLFPLVYGAGGLITRKRDGTALPADVSGLLQVSIVQLAIFFVIFAIAWLASRANATQLMLPWRNGWMTLLLGFAYSFCLRIVIMIGLVVFVVPWVLALGAHSESVKQLKPNVGRLINTAALTGDPVYFVLCLTLISFVVAALREELWRAGMIAGVRQLFPRLFASVRGKIAAVMIVALIFGLGHTLQGWSGVAIATVLGVGLGLIMVRHRSIWEAVIAHGFFDAGTFALMFLIAKFLPGQHT